MKQFFVFLCCCLCWSSMLCGQEKYSKLRVYLEGQSVQDLLVLGLTCDHGKHRPRAYFESDFSAEDRRLLDVHGFRYEVLAEDVTAYYQQQNLTTPPKSMVCDPTGSTKVYPKPSNFSLGSMGGYLTYQELLDNLDSMAAQYPHLITAKTVIDSSNLSHENRPIYWVKISDNPTIDENEPEALYNALHHAREPLGLSQLVYYMWYLLENYATNPEVQYLVNHTELYFIPCLNPDGYIYNELTNPSGGGMWRKNRRNNGGSYGVDLNRNYAFAFAHDNIGSSGNPVSDDYRGPAAFSEPETQNMRDFCLAHDFVFSLNYHTYGALLIYPWAYNNQLTIDSNAYRSYAQILTQENRYAYGTNGETVGYVSNGDADDWLYGEQNLKNKIFSMTSEAATGGFWPAASTIVGHCQQTMWQNLALAHLLLNYGEVQDKSTALVRGITTEIVFDLRRYGRLNGNFTVSILPLSANIQAVGTPTTISIAPFAQQTDSITLVLDPSIASGDTVRYILMLDNGGYIQGDTIERIYGNHALAFDDALNTMNHWNNLGSQSNWEITNFMFHSPTGCLTDSKIGNYHNNTTSEILLNQTFNLTTATDANLSFWAQWDIEKDYDYVQIMAAGSDSVFHPLCGRYTNEGTIYQDLNAPLYDGLQEQWVAEQISLNDFLGDSVVQVKLRLVSDIWVTEDGFYFDDFKVNILDPTLVGNTSLQASKELYIDQNQPNPAQWKAYIPFNLEEEGAAIFCLKITNVLGQEVHQEWVETTEKGVELDVGDWLEGVYFYQLVGQNARSKPYKMVIAR